MLIMMVLLVVTVNWATCATMLAVIYRLQLRIAKEDNDSLAQYCVDVSKSAGVTYFVENNVIHAKFPGDPTDE